MPAMIASRGAVNLPAGLGMLIDPAATRQRTVRIERVILGAIAVLTALHCLYFFNQACDDGYISLGYAKRWIEGRGLTLNDVAPSKGYSNLLWVVLLAGWMKLGVDGLVAAKVMGVACAVGVSVVGVRLARATGGGVWAQLGAGLFIAGAVPLAAWSAQSLETPLYALEVAALALFACRGGRRWGRFAFALTAGAMTVTRPEGAIVAGSVCIALRVLRPWPRVSQGGIHWTLIVLVILMLAHEAFRVVIFGTWVGNSAVHKWHPMAIGRFVERSLSRLAQLTGFWWHTQSLAVWSVLLLPFVRRRARRRLMPTGLLLLACVSFHILVGGDVGAYFRFLVPVIALVGVLLARVGTTGSTRSPVRRALRLTGPVLAAVMGVSGAVSMLRWIPLPSNFYACPSLIRPTAHAEVARWLERHARPSDRVLLSEMGLIPYATGLPCFDFLGLCDRYMYTEGARFHPERFDQHRPAFVVLSFMVFDGGRISARLPAENDLLQQPGFLGTFQPVADFKLDKTRSLMEYGYYGNRPGVGEIRFTIFARRGHPATQRVPD